MDAEMNFNLIESNAFIEIFISGSERNILFKYINKQYYSPEK